MKKMTKTQIIRSAVLIGITILIAAIILFTKKKPIEEKNETNYTTEHSHEESTSSLIGQTCMSPGTYYIYCSCGELIRKEEGTEILEHEFTEVKTEANCMEMEKIIKTCSRCGLEEVEQIGEKLSHVDEDNDNICDMCNNWITE